MTERLEPDAGGIARAADLVRRGEVVAFPTDTVYGLMALPEAAGRIYDVKRRPADKRLVVMAAESRTLERLVAISPRNRAYIERYWPGPLTLVLPAAEPGAPSLGVRIPKHRLALELLRAAGRPVVTTSANLSGRPPAMQPDEIALDGVAAVLDGGTAPGGVASTVLLADRPDPEVAREGAIPARELLLFDQAWKLRTFAEREAGTSSAIWHAVCLALAEEPIALELLLSARLGQRRPNLLLAAIHYLLLAGEQHRLREYLPSDGGQHPGGRDLGPAAADFVRSHADQLREVVGRRSTQTNEVGRSWLLLLGLAWLPQPLALIDAGTSAGLNLQLDRFRYRFGDRFLGDPASPIEIEARWRTSAPPVPPGIPRIAWRAGLDANPLDVRDEETARWLNALVWPEHSERRQRLLAAIEMRRESPDVIRRGDLVADLPALVDEARRHAETVAVVHSNVLAYLTHEHVEEFVALCRTLDVWRIGLEGVAGSPDRNLLTINDEAVARAGPHGTWADWLTPVNEEGEPVTSRPPRGSSVGVHRKVDGERRWLMLHRAKHGAGYDGAWGWGPPGGSRLPGEASAACARRELLEETGLAADPTPAGSTGRWDMYACEAPADWEPRLSAEHDRYEWLPLPEALERSRPAAARTELGVAAKAAGHD